MRQIFLSALFAQVCIMGVAQNKATVKEFTKTFTTYPFSDPSPIPDPSAKIYPYFRYDGLPTSRYKKNGK
jgi:hypothetical protein